MRSVAGANERSFDGDKMMKAFPVVGVSALLLLLGWTVPADSRQEPDKPKNQEKQQQVKPAEKQQQAKPAEKQQPAKSAKQDQSQAKTQQNHQDNKSVQQRSPAQVHQQQVAWQGERAHNWQSEHRSWQQRGGYNGYRVPDDRFNAYYGQDHVFFISSLPVVFVGGQQRFQYGGYWFGLIDPWPESWSSDWYDSDDVWVVYYGDGYYLCNRRHPEDRVAVSFYLS
jgi:hypothetical protein